MNKLFYCLFCIMFISYPMFGYSENGKYLKNNTSNDNKNYGYFSTNQLRVQWIDNGKRAKLLEPLIFTDPQNKKWFAPKGHIIDGASIPPVFQSFVGTPFGGEYLLASVIHDVACDEKKESWKAVHKVFHYAMLASGVSPTKAAVMYKAVYEGGPRWGAKAEKKLTTKQLISLLSSSSSLYGSPEVLFGSVRAYDGEAVYMHKRKDGEATLGIVKNYNSFSFGVERGDKKKTYAFVSWGKEASKVSNVRYGVRLESTGILSGYYDGNNIKGAVDHNPFEDLYSNKKTKAR